MKSTMDRVPTWLALMAAAILTFTFTACSDNEDIENEVTYTYVFTEISASHPDFLEEKGKIENAFKSALGATGSNFTKRGYGGRVRQTSLRSLRESLQFAQGRSVARRLPLRSDKHPYRRGSVHGCIQCRQRKHLRWFLAGCEREYSKELYQFCQEDIPRLPRCTIRGGDMH